MKIYIAGKISGLTPEQFHQKFEDFKVRVEYYFRNYLGVAGEKLEIIVPCEICQDDWDWFKCMKVCVDKLVKCNAIVMMDDWTDSKGATCEYYIALHTHKDIWYQKGIDEYYAEKEKDRGTEA